MSITTALAPYTLPSRRSSPHRGHRLRSRLRSPGGTGRLDKVVLSRFCKWNGPRLLIAFRRGSPACESRWVPASKSPKRFLPQANLGKPLFEMIATPLELSTSQIGQARSHPFRRTGAVKGVAVIGRGEGSLDGKGRSQMMWQERRRANLRRGCVARIAPSPTATTW